MASRWLAPRALLAHVAIVIWVPLCAGAARWQISRAASGNTLSYLYAVEWPALAIFGIWGWWMLIHTDKPTAEQIAAREQLEAARRAEAKALAEEVVARVDDEDMAAYNAHLASLAARERKSWKH